jgi:diguanylate cyclase (GGDEF) domain
MNAILVGLFCRYSFFNRLHYYLICLLVLLSLDIFWGVQGPGTVLVNLSNVSFVLLLTNAILRERDGQKNPLKINVLRLYSYCLLASLICAILGSYGFSRLIPGSFWSVYPVWFSESFSTSVLILPFLLTCSGTMLSGKFELRKMLPVCLLALTLAASGFSGGIGCLSITLPALVWCAISYSLPTTCLLTLLAGSAEVLMVYSNWVQVGIQGHALQIISARMGIASLAISPVMVAVSVQAINNLVRQLSARANFDYLTRVYSRFGLYEKLRVGEQKSSSTPLNVLLLDIDHFKKINDTHGHDCGDNVLVIFASRVKEIVGDQGIVARMGGEEFAVVIPHARDDKGYLLAEAIRADIEQMQVSWGSDNLSLTVSIGVSHGEAEQQEMVDAFDRLLSEADRYLYQSKHSGRNRTSAAPAVMTRHLAHDGTH